MNSTAWTDKQRAALIRKSTAVADYYRALLDRMNERRFSTSDPVWRAARRAVKAADDLTEEIRSSKPREMTYSDPIHELERQLEGREKPDS